jgi:hypothetical protein
MKKLPAVLWKITHRGGEIIGCEPARGVGEISLARRETVIELTRSGGGV